MGHSASDGPSVGEAPKGGVMFVVFRFWRSKKIVLIFRALEAFNQVKLGGKVGDAI